MLSKLEIIAKSTQLAIPLCHPGPHPHEGLNKSFPFLLPSHVVDKPAQHVCIPPKPAQVLSLTYDLVAAGIILQCSEKKIIFLTSKRVFDGPCVSVCDNFCIRLLLG